jgi:hypothetical protein
MADFKRRYIEEKAIGEAFRVHNILTVGNPGVNFHHPTPSETPHSSQFRKR